MEHAQAEVLPDFVEPLRQSQLAARLDEKLFPTSLGYANPVRKEARVENSSTSRKAISDRRKFCLVLL